MEGERWIVDAMNVIGSRPDGWWNDPGRAMREFASAVDAHAGASEKAITVVFDKDPGDLPEMTHIDVAIARQRGRNAADHEIERLVADDPDPTRLRIVTSDRRLAEEIRAAGATVVPAGSFRQELDR